MDIKLTRLTAWLIFLELHEVVRYRCTLHQSINMFTSLIKIFQFFKKEFATGQIYLAVFSQNMHVPGIHVFFSYWFLILHGEWIDILHWFVPASNWGYWNFLTIQEYTADSFDTVLCNDIYFWVCNYGNIDYLFLYIRLDKVWHENKFSNILNSFFS